MKLPNIKIKSPLFISLFAFFFIIITADIVVPKSNWTNIFHLKQPASVYQIPHDGLVAYWNFDEGSSTTVNDVSGNAIDGTWNGTGVHYVDGKVGQAGQFNGIDDYVQLPNSPSLHFGSSDFTVETWFYWTGTPADGSNGDIYTAGNWGGPNEFRMFIENGMFKMTMRGENGTILDGFPDQTPLQTNTWYHVAAVREGDQFRIYRNGELIDTITNSDSIFNEGAAPIIGKGDAFFNGMIDEFAVYNRALSVDEINTIYDGSGQYDWGVTTIPSAPIIRVVSFGDKSANVSFVPSSNGGSPITGYTVTSEPSGGVDENAGTTNLEHNITNLVNGTSYTFTVTATNEIGTSLPSDISNSIIPKPSVGLPYVLYNGDYLYISQTDNAPGGYNNVPWSFTYDITGAQSETDGVANTNTIVSYYPSETSLYAAKVCSDLIFDGYDDWYLPAVDQLKTIYEQKNNINKGNYASEWIDFNSDGYWTSTEDTSLDGTFPWGAKSHNWNLGWENNYVYTDNASVVYFWDGSYGPHDKLHIHGGPEVRCVRNSALSDNTPINNDNSGTSSNASHRRRPTISEGLGGNTEPEVTEISISTSSTSTTEAVEEVTESTSTQIQENTSVTSTPVSATPINTTLVFTRNLKLTSSGDDVKLLQQYLNSKGFVISATGPGSIGNETTFFGEKTKEALIKFQETYKDLILKPFNLSVGTGFFGKVTRDFINNNY